MKSIILIIVLVVLGAAIALFSVECSRCDGAGTLGETKEVSVRCAACAGSGQVDNSKKGSLLAGKDVKKLGSTKRQCLKCRGAGELKKIVPLGKCDACTGTGSVKNYSRFMPVK